MNTQTNKCTHEKVCQECLKEEIVQLESTLKELKDKLPNNTNVYIQKYIQPGFIFPYGYWTTC